MAHAAAVVLLGLHPACSIVQSQKVRDPADMHKVHTKVAFYHTAQATYLVVLHNKSFGSMTCTIAMFAVNFCHQELLGSLALSSQVHQICVSRYVSSVMTLSCTTRSTEPQPCFVPELACS